jgi:serine/threonine protein kinase
MAPWDSNSLDGLSELVLRTRLPTRYTTHQPPKTVHTYGEPHPNSPGEIITSEECWERVCFIGGGGFARVFKEKCFEGRRIDEFRAVKEIFLTKETSRISKYNRELEANAIFSSEECEKWFVKSYGWFSIPNVVYLTMEYFELGNLHEHIKAFGALPESEVKTIMHQILEGLSYMHSKGYAHRDLKLAVRSCNHESAIQSLT